MEDVPDFVYQPLTHPETHTRVLAIFPGPPDAPLRLGIDFAHLGVKDEIKYNALSYTWGRSTDQSEVEIRLKYNPETQCIQCGCTLDKVGKKSFHPTTIPRQAQGFEESETEEQNTEDPNDTRQVQRTQVLRTGQHARDTRRMHFQQNSQDGEPASSANIEAAYPIRRKMRISSNLEKALRHLRNPDDGWMAWADGICINQADDEEKSHQVRNMDLVYEGATRTTIWLGESADDSDLAADLLDEYSKYQQDDSERCYERNFDDDLFLHRTRSWTKHWEALGKLMSRPWFRRRWIIQEVVLSSPPEVLCGNREIPWCNIWQVSQFLLAALDTPFSFPISEDVHAAIHIVKFLHDSQAHGRDCRCSAMTLEQLCTMFFSSLCTDPRDIVYSLLSLAKDVDRQKLFPDYSPNVSVRDVFVQCFDIIVTNTQSLDFMFHSKHRPPSADIETWLPCLGPGARSCECGKSGGDEGILNPVSQGENQASLRTAPEYNIEKTAGTFTLIASGHICFLVIYGTDDEDDSEEDKEYARFYETFDEEKELATFNETMKGISPRVNILFLEARDLVRLSGGPARKGDVVCVLLGCSSPVVLRPCSPDLSEYYFLCACAIEGIMRGEFMERCLQNSVPPQKFRIR